MFYQIFIIGFKFIWKKNICQFHLIKWKDLQVFSVKLKPFCSLVFSLFILKLSKGLGEDVMALIYISLSICCISIHCILLKSVSFFSFSSSFFIESLLRYRRSRWIIMDTLTIWNVNVSKAIALAVKTEPMYPSCWGSAEADAVQALGYFRS